MFVEYYERERACCTVKALSKCLNIPFKEAHKILSEKGRKTGCRFDFREQTIGDLGLKTREELSCKRLKTVLPLLNNGRFIIKVRGHVFPIIDGVVYDFEEPNYNRHVVMVYQYEP